ncbi:oligosaccharide repeat unit polymerase [Escherichia coli]|uniref:O-antigen polymerase n=1 Tax=Escherichia coli TaxID=562 RepID=UPI002FE678FB
MIIVLCAIVLFIRVLWLFYFKKSYHIGFLLPFFLEVIFVYPYIVMDSLGLKWSYFGFIVNYSIVLTVQVGAAFTVNIPSNNIRFIPPRNVYKLAVVLILFSFVGVISNLTSILSLFRGVGALLELSHQNAVSRYDGTLKVSVLYKISSVLSYFTTFLLSMMYAIRKTKKTLLFICLHFLVLLLDSVLMAARAGMMLQTFCFLANFYAFSYYTQKREGFRVSLRKILGGVSFVLLVFIFFVIIQIVRGGKVDSEIAPIVSHVLTWFVGYIPCFDVWISQYYNYDITFGQRTFVGLFDLFGLSERVSGVYPAIDIGNERYSNIFTAYRGLIEDFSIAGLYVILLLLGGLLSFIPNYVARRGNIFWAPLTGFIVFFFFWSYVINPYSYNVIFFAALLFWGYFIFFVRARFCD